MEILNKKTDNIPADAIYIGRGSHLGNPYAIRESGDREEVLKAYDLYLNKEVDRKNPIILLKLRELTEQSQLVCYCRPAQCHGDIIARVWRDRIKPMQHQRSLSYAGIGSRTTPPEVMALMTKLARRLDELGFVLRSGGADGADSAFEDGTKNKQVFLPWEGFNGRESEFTSPSSEAFRVAEIVHDGWQYLKPGAQKLMARNSHQILGADMRSPCDFVVCWTQDGAERKNQRGRSTGGTGQAIDLADRFGIPVFNLANGIEILGSGVAYHYSRHADEILTNGFLGAPLTLDLDSTQSPVENHKATHNPGVVFCYESLEETAEEGDCAKYLFPGCEPKIFKINFTAAVRAVHVQETLLEAPPTIMISTTEIESFECLGPCSDFWDESDF